MSNRDKQGHPIKSFTQDELEGLKQDQQVCNQDRRTFLKWGAMLSSQAIVGGGVLNLLTGEVHADDTFVNVKTWVYSVCGYCSVGCGLHIGVNSAGEAVAVRGNKNHPTNAGRVCVKGLYEYKILNDKDLRVGERGKYPLLRNSSGGYDIITWDAAITLLSQKIIDAVNVYGPDSVGLYNTGQWMLEEYYSMGKLGKGAIGTSTMDSNTRLCMAAAVYGYMSSFGSDGPPGCYDDIENTNCFFLIGTNPAEMHPQVWRRIVLARKSWKAPKLIVVDPRRTQTARSADLHLQLKPGTNVALMNGLIQQIIANNKVNTTYVNSYTRNYAALAAKVAAYTPDYVSSITGVPAADIQTAALWIGNSQEVWSMFIQGVYQSMGATDTVRLICSMHLIMGKIGRAGSAPFSITGQSTAMSNREAGGSSALSAYRNYYNPTHVSALETLWNVPAGKIPRHSPTMITSNKDLQPTINSMVDMMKNGQLKVFWVACSNPAVTLPDLNKFYSYLDFGNPSRPFTVVQDIYDPMETKAFADLFLPAAQWGEKTGTYTCSERKVNLGKQAVNPPGFNLRPNYGAYSDFDIIKKVADKLAALDARFRDKNGNSLITYTTTEQCFNEWKNVSKGRPCDMSGMTYANIESNNGVAWPSTTSNVLGGKRLYTNGVFNTNWDRAQYGTSASAPWIDPENKSRAYLWAVDYVPPPEVPDATYPFWLNSGRVIEHFHSRTKTKRVAQLHEMVPENYVEMHPNDASALGVTTGDLVAVTSRRGSITVKAKVTDTVRQGAVFIPMHFGDLDPSDVAQNNGRQVAVNRLTMNYVDPVCGQPIYKHCAVKLAKG
ncbi:MAG: molybdopterin-dependent oxidoreductase [Gammaproteobacteria bacterium]|nr:molybdopterin-dependent oxidoreductase [Gammaproteobacteria bacterium]MBU1978001.1 molybdopterin-dependent oxidoreductase [Gammaproteobacteria bacterium]